MLLKYKYFLLLLMPLLLIDEAYAQKTGEAIYQVQLVENENDYLQQTYLKSLPNAEDYISESEFILKFKDEKSEFKLHDILYSNNAKVELAISFVGYNGRLIRNENQVLSDTRDTPVHQGKWSEVAFNVDWEITQESKQIDDFQAFKAFGTVNEEVFNQSTGEFETQNSIIEAWFCPSIPIPHGPLGYGDLPGLIIELHTSVASFGLIKLNLNKKNEIEVVDNKDILTKLQLRMIEQKELKGF